MSNNNKHTEGIKEFEIEYSLRDYIKNGYSVKEGDKLNLKYWLRTYWDDDYYTLEKDMVDFYNNPDIPESYLIILKVIPSQQPTVEQQEKTVTEICNDSLKNYANLGKVKSVEQERDIEQEAHDFAVNKCKLRPSGKFFSNLNYEWVKIGYKEAAKANTVNKESDQVKKNKLSQAFKQVFPEFSPSIITWFRKNKDLL